MIDDDLEQLTECIDRLISVEFRPPVGSVPAGLVAPLYDLLRQHQGRPLTSLASELLVSLAPQRRVLIVTGAGIAPALPAGETDGPPGAVALAYALHRGFSCEPVLVTEQSHAPAVANCLETLELSAATIDLFPSDGSPVSAADRLLDIYSPSAVVFVERDGRNLEGRYHGVRGNCRPLGTVAPADELAGRAELRGIPTLGIGDGGNEVGFGAVRDEASALFPDGGVCHDGCASGRVTSVATDVCVTASVSNWGAYGVVAALAARAKRPDLLLPACHERLLIDACLRGGAKDGATSSGSLSVDGVSASGNEAVLTLLHELVSIHVRS